MLQVLDRDKHINMKILIDAIYQQVQISHKPQTNAFGTVGMIDQVE